MEGDGSDHSRGEGEPRGDENALDESAFSEHGDAAGVSEPGQDGALGRGPDVEKRFAALEAECMAAEERGDLRAEARAYARLANLHERYSEIEAARESHRRARALYEQGDDGAAAAAAVVAMGDMEARLRRMEAAARLFHEASDLYQRLPLPERAAHALLSEADAMVKLGRRDAALDRIDAAETLFAGIDDTLGQAHSAYRLAALCMGDSPVEADEQLELAARLFSDHVSRDVEQIDVALPDTVSDSRRYPPFVMQRVCLRERQRLSGGRAGAGQLPSRYGGARRMRGESEALPSQAQQSSALTTWIGVGILLVGGLAFLGPQLVKEGGPLEFVAEAVGGSVAPTTLMHVGMGILGAVVAMIAAHQIGISAPVVLLALGIGVGMIFHEVGRAVFPNPEDSIETAVTQALESQGEAARQAHGEAANHILEGRRALAAGNVAMARVQFEKAYRIWREIVDSKGQVRALEELLALEREHGTLEEQVAAAERLYDDLRGYDESRGREVLDQIVVDATDLGERAQLREAQVKLLAYHEREGDTAGEVKALMALAGLDRDSGDLDRAYEWYRRAHGGYQTLRDTPGQIKTLLAMGEIDARLGRRRRAYGRYYQAFAMYREIDDAGGQAAMLLHMGAIDEASERYDEAIAAFRQAERLYDELGDDAGAALAALRFGSTQVAHGNQRQAREGFLRSLALYEAVGDVGGQARAHLGLGNHWLKVGNRIEASRHYELARALYARLGDAPGQLVALREMAIIAHESGSGTIAGHRLDEARMVTRQVADPAARASMLLSTGDLALSLDRADDARTTYREALSVYESLGDEAGRRAADERLARLQSAG